MKLPGFFQFLIFPGPLMLEGFKGLMPGKDYSIHRECFGTEMCIKEVNRENKYDRQQCFVTMNDLGHIDAPTGQEAGEDLRKP